MHGQYNSGPDNDNLVGDLSVLHDIETAVDRICDGAAVAIDNYVVGAISGDASNPAFAASVEVIKRREPKRPYGLTIDAQTFLPLVDLSQVNRDLWGLFEDVDKYVSVFGATSFVRAPTRHDILENAGLPASVISAKSSDHFNAPIPIIQNWTPEGKDNFEVVRLVAARRGVKYMGVTSLNLTTEPEITKPDQIYEFAAGHGMTLLTDRHALIDDNGERKLSGSYPIVSVDSDGLTLVRNRWAGGLSFMKRLLSDYPLHVEPSLSEDPGLNELEKLKGPELRLAFMSYLGWTATKTEFQP